MKKPDKIIRWFHVEKKKDDLWIDFNGKPSYSYTVHIPYWLGRAYKLGRVNQVKVEIRNDVPSMRDQENEETKEEYWKYFKENWSNKMTKMRKLNHNYLLFAEQGKGKGWFQSIEDYNNYHIELDILNKKYGVRRPRRR